MKFLIVSLAIFTNVASAAIQNVHPRNCTVGSQLSEEQLSRSEVYICGDYEERTPLYCVFYDTETKTYSAEDYMNRATVYKAETVNERHAEFKGTGSGCESWGWPTISFQVNSQSQCVTTRHHKRSLTFLKVHGPMLFSSTWYRDSRWSKWHNREITTRVARDQSQMVCKQYVAD